jgi:hypothetical protein
MVTVKLSQAAEIQLLQSRGEDQTQIDTKLGLSVALPEPGGRRVWLRKIKISHFCGSWFPGTRPITQKAGAFLKP